MIGLPPDRGLRVMVELRGGCSASSHKPWAIMIGQLGTGKRQLRFSILIVALILVVQNLCIRRWEMGSIPTEEQIVDSGQDWV